MNKEEFSGTEVKLREGEDVSQLIRRFIRLTKSEQIVAEYIDATKAYKKKSMRKRLKRKRAEIRRRRDATKLKQQRD